jgi:hypothetical protein
MTEPGEQARRGRRERRERRERRGRGRIMWVPQEERVEIRGWTDPSPGPRTRMELIIIYCCPSYASCLKLPPPRNRLSVGFQPAPILAPPERRIGRTASTPDKLGSSAGELQSRFPHLLRFAFPSSFLSTKFPLAPCWRRSCRVSIQFYFIRLAVA